MVKIRRRLNSSMASLRASVLDSTSHLQIPDFMTPKTSTSSRQPLTPMERAGASSISLQTDRPNTRGRPTPHTEGSGTALERPNMVLTRPSASSMPMGVDSSRVDDDEDEDVELEENAFNHPATYREQRWIWVPKDQLGLSASVVEDLRRAGVEASDLGASMGAEGQVKVSRNREYQARECMQC